MKAVKYDSEKVRLDLWPIRPYYDIAKVLTYGANKYSTNQVLSIIGAMQKLEDIFNAHPGEKITKVITRRQGGCALKSIIEEALVDKEPENSSREEINFFYEGEQKALANFYQEKKLYNDTMYSIVQFTLQNSIYVFVSKSDYEVFSSIFEKLRERHPSVFQHVALSTQDGVKIIWTEKGDHNWRQNMSWSRLYAATLRHLTQWWLGQDLDSESGLPHLAHAACNLLFLIEYQYTNTKLDDRYKQ